MYGTAIISFDTIINLRSQITAKPSTTCYGLIKSMETIITLPEPLFERVVKRAQENSISPERFVIDVLSSQLEPQHPYVETVRGAGDARPVIRGTRTGVDTIVGYFRVGYSPKEIADDILPHLKLTEVYDALSYYEDHRQEVDSMMERNSPEAWRVRLIHEMGEAESSKFLGEN